MLRNHSQSRAVKRKTSVVHQTLFVIPRNDVAREDIKSEQRHAAASCNGKEDSSSSEITVEKCHHSHDNP